MAPGWRQNCGQRACRLAAFDLAAVGHAIVEGAGHARTVDQRGRLCGVSFGRADVGCQTPPAHCARPRVGGAWGEQLGRGLHGRIPRDRRFCPFGGELRCRCANASGRRLYRGGHLGGGLAAHAGTLFCATSHALCHHCGGGAVFGGPEHPAQHLGLLAIRLRGCGGDPPGDLGCRRGRGFGCRRGPFSLVVPL